ncbi:SDR family oxidoreductase [Corynebacterium sp.]|uniref:SDR family oxidoreductase n=1 Tax=Corynebacterium sp. TaxID=1720 RepID=UPI0026DC010E|nr:SDR family oxidoreductase [Corynebacterium sp.]MDO5075901.1 SDR family oxidoreductase [Corynebacterium sp.]
MTAPTSLNGRTALVTGGSSGIGLGIARALATAGANVVVAALDDAHLAALTEFVTVPCDVTKLEDCRNAVARAVDAFGNVDIVAANAGAYPRANIEDIDAATLGELTELNVGGTANIVVAALPYLKRSRAGRIVVTSSITGNITGFPQWAHYGATKAAQMGYVRTAAIELARDGITCNAVLPGNILTPSLLALGEDYVNQMAQSIPGGKLGTTEDVGNVVAFLASDAARYISGQGIVVDGGQVLPESPPALMN